MDTGSFSLEQIATIASFVVPGYFAIQAYRIVHTKIEKDFAVLLIESIACSLPIIGLYSVFWRYILPGHSIHSTSVGFFLPLIAVSSLIGFIVGKGRNMPWLLAVSEKLLLPSPSDDFLETQFDKLAPDSIVTVGLRDGKVFCGVRTGMSRYRKGEAQRCYFSFFAWRNTKTRKWGKRSNGSLIISIEDIQFIETKEDLNITYLKSSK